MVDVSVELIWPDGTLTSGRTYREVEDRLRADQWTQLSRRAFREEMRRRAEVWSGSRLPSRRTSRGFIRSLADAGLCLIIEES
jgi:hypothetical protein